MASASANRALENNFFLTPQQQSLLFAALNSNQPVQSSPTVNDMSFSPTSFQSSPVQKDGVQESPYLDNYDYDFGPDSSFDFDFSGDVKPKMIGDIPEPAKSESPENDAHDKRSHPDDDDENSPENSSGNGNKKRESTEKVAKKPGRKPLTSEPSSKRKAQNRAAQRAFRERKEKHLKDLETKVQELEKASEAANHENELLRAKVDQMTTELNEYKRKASIVTKPYTTQRASNGFGHAAISNLNDVNFQFEFPKFGVLPGPSATLNKPAQRSNSSLPSPPAQLSSGPVSPQQQTKESSKSPSKVNVKGEDLATLSGIFSPPLTTNTVNNASRGSLDSGNFSLGYTAGSSPSASSNSNGGPSSSCGTSPEPFTQSPMGFKPVDTMTTIGEEQSSSGIGQGFSQFAGIDINNAGFDWFAQQNGGQFDPQLFGNYREPQENILATGTFDDSFFNDAFDADFLTPYNVAPSPAVAKKNLIAEIDAKQNADDDMQIEEKLSCNKMWEKLQNCPKVQNGEFDLDGLCSELQKKAKCSGSGPVVAETDFQAVFKKFMGKDGPCADKPVATEA